MEEFIIAVASGLILAAVSGLVFLAYKHPDGYETLAIILIFLIVVVCALSSFYLFGYFNACEASGNTNYNPDWLLWDWGTTFALILFLILLMKLPLITKTDEEDDADKNKPPKRKRP
jgi:branched-subunit amino acid ABC-type transport system permease component